MCVSERRGGVAQVGVTAGFGHFVDGGVGISGKGNIGRPIAIL